MNIDRIDCRFGGRIGFTCSTFDLLHAGHVAMLQDCKKNCDYLIAGILTDPTHDRSDTKSKPIQSIFERWMQLSAIQYVDEIIPFDDEVDLKDLLLTIKPHVRIVGVEYKGREFTGSDIEDIELVFNERDHTFSTTELRKRIVEEGYPKETPNYAETLPEDNLHIPKEEYTHMDP